MAGLYDLSMMEGITMLDLLSALYEWDTFRFALWHTLDMFGLDACLTAWLESHGYVVWDDFSVSGGNQP